MWKQRLVSNSGDKSILIELDQLLADTSTFLMEWKLKRQKKTVSWGKRMEMSNIKWELCRPIIFETMLSNQAVMAQNCLKCNSKAGYIQCTQCCGMGRLCGACDLEQHKQHPFHDRQYASPDGFLQFILPTESMDCDGNLINISKFLYTTGAMIKATVL